MEEYGQDMSADCASGKLDRKNTEFHFELTCEIILAWLSRGKGETRYQYYLY